MGNSVVQKKIIAKIFEESTKIKTLSKLIHRQSNTQIQTKLNQLGMKQVFTKPKKKAQ